MRHLLRRSRPVAAAAVLSLALAACGTDAETTDPETTETSASETADDTGSETMSDDMSSETGTEAMGGEYAVPVDSSGDPFADLRGAAEHVVMSASTLSGGIAAAAGMDGAVDSPAAQLQAGLTALLQEHVYLAGITLDTGAAFGFDSQEFELAAAQLDANSVKLADAVGSIAGEEKRDAFLSLWRQHIQFFVDYTVGVAQGDQALQDEALTNLDNYRADAGAFFEEITGGALPADAVAESLAGHVDTVVAAIDAVAAGDTSVFDNLKAAADHVNGAAKTLAGGIAQAAGLEGDVSSAAATLHADLAGLLQEHVYLAGVAVKTAYAAGPDSDAFTAATETLDANSQELATAVGSIAGEEKGQAFLDLWRQHIGFFVDFAVAAAGGDEDAKVQAISDLAGYTQDAGAFFEEITGGELPADAVAGSLEQHITTLAGAIESLSGVSFS